jgi:Leucine-rich repeat (LRR) protein
MMLWRYFARKTAISTVLLWTCLLQGHVCGQPLLDASSLSRKPLLIWKEAQKIHPDSVYRLRVRQKLPNDFETKVLLFPHLQELQLSGLRLEEIPPVVWKLHNLTVLHAAHNKLSTLPPQIGQLVYLEELDLNRNYLTCLPSEIRHLQKLHYLDLWSNLIFALPPDMAILENSLFVIDMRVIMLNDEEKAAMRALLPKTNFIFSNSCGCTH